MIEKKTKPRSPTLKKTKTPTKLKSSDVATETDKKNRPPEILATQDNESQETKVNNKSANVSPAPVGFAELAFAGDLVLLKCLDPAHQKKILRYQKFFEYCANLDKNYRLFLYRFLNALMLTSHAKRLKEPALRKHIFEVKNQLIFSLMNDPIFRVKIKYVYLKSSQFKVQEYCGECTEANKTLKRHEWKFCKNCVVNWAYYDVVGLQHFFDKGKATIFLGDEAINQVPQKIIKAKARLEDTNEEIVFNNNIHFNPRNLNAITLKSVITFSEKLLTKAKEFQEKSAALKTPPKRDFSDRASEDGRASGGRKDAKSPQRSSYPSQHSANGPRRGAK